jgi:hypothetical protein
MIKNGCHAEALEAWWAGPLCVRLRRAQGDRPSFIILPSVHMGFKPSA